MSDQANNPTPTADAAPTSPQARPDAAPSIRGLLFSLISVAALGLAIAALVIALGDKAPTRPWGGPIPARTASSCSSPSRAQQVQGPCPRAFGGRGLQGSRAEGGVASRSDGKASATPAPSQGGARQPGGEGAASPEGTAAPSQPGSEGPGAEGAGHGEGTGQTGSQQGTAPPGPAQP